MNNDVIIDKNIQEEVNDSKDYIFFQRFMTLIESKGFTQSQFAEHIGLSRQFFWQIVHKKMIPKIGLRLKIAKALDTDSALIWRDEDEL